MFLSTDNSSHLHFITNIHTENDGLKQDGTPDGRVGTGGKSVPFSYRAYLIIQTEFAHGKVDPVEAGKAGGIVKYARAYG